MKRALMMSTVAVAILFSSLPAAEWTNRTGLTIRGSLISPMLKGDDYRLFHEKEPFMMGGGAGFDIRQGLTKNFVAAFSLSNVITYDDTTATSDQSFSFFNKDNAYTRLHGILADVTLQYYFWPQSGVQPYILGGIGIDFWKLTALEDSPQLGPTFKDDRYRFSDWSAKAGAGLIFWLGERLSFDIQGKFSYGINNLNAQDTPLFYGGVSRWKTRPFRAYLQPSVGLTYHFGAEPDADKDGVKDKLDKCPDTPVGAVVDENGCPVDSDNDGVFDGLDQCANTPSGCVVDIAGCPLDTDKDGVCDGLDKCPNTPPGASVDAQGCPIDSDGDGVPDFKDKCPNTTRGCLVDDSGCPKDGDGDGVCDGMDKCPTTPSGTQVDQNGCPVNVKPPVQKITLNIKYATGSYEPDQKSKAVLDDLIATMKAYTGTKIQVNGFTDNVGSDQANMTLSQKRAEAVRDYLIKGGVEAERITVQGFGEDPQYFVADNSTAEGRQANRRVEILSVE